MGWNQFWRSILIFLLMRFCNVYFFNFIMCINLMWNMSTSNSKYDCSFRIYINPLRLWTTYNTVWSLVSNSAVNHFQISLKFKETLQITLVLKTIKKIRELFFNDTKWTKTNKISQKSGREENGFKFAKMNIAE